MRLHTGTKRERERERSTRRRQQRKEKTDANLALTAVRKLDSFEGVFALSTEVRKLKK